MRRISSEKVVNELKNILYRFPLTIIFIILLTVWQLFNEELLFTLEPMFLLLLTGIIFSATSQLIYEHFFVERPKMRWTLYGIVIVLAALYYMYLTFSLASIDEGAWSFYSIPGIRTMILYFVSILVFIWVPSIKGRIKFSESFLVAFKAFYSATFFSIILFIGLFLILNLFEFLFFSVNTDWFSYSSTIVFCLFAPLLFLSFIPEYYLVDREDKKREESVENAISIPKFLHHLISYILIPVMAILTGIIVLYIVTNLTNDFFEENILEGLLLSYAINGWMLLILADSIENKIAQWFKKIFPYLLIFVIVIQMISTFLQIQEVGITHGRYIILLFGVGSVISAAWYIVKKQNLKVLPIIAIIAGLIALVPPVDALSVSVRSQRDRIDAVFEEYNMRVDEDYVASNPNVTEDDQDTIRESLNYLSEINALNQLTWLPEEHYYQEDVYLGFRTAEEGPKNPEDRFRDERNQTDVYIEMDSINIPIGDFEHLIDLQLNDQSQQFNDSVEIDGQMYELEISSDEEFIVRLTPSDSGTPIEFDFGFVLDELEGETGLQLPLEDLTFTQEVGEHEAQIIIQYLSIHGDFYQIEFLLLI